MKLQIDSNDKAIVSRLMGDSSPQMGDSVEVAPGVQLTYFGGSTHAVDPTTVLTFVFDNLQAVATGVVAAYLYDKLKGLTAKVKIDDHETPLTKKDLEETLKRFCSKSKEKKRNDIQ